jgi:hypothetical protein
MAPEVVLQEVSGPQRELTASVCRVLAEELSGEALEWLRTELPERMAELLVPGAPPADVTPVHGSNLATGRPGATRPLSEAHPEPSHDTLAEGRPGSTRPVSERRR